MSEPESDSSQPQGYEGARRKAEILVRDPEGAKAMLDRATEKARRLEDSPKTASFIDELKSLFRLIKAWNAGAYTDMPWGTVVASMAALIYFVSPLDFVPDLIPIIGFVDDAAIVMWVVNRIRKDLERFRIWERDRTDADGAASAGPSE